MSNKKPQSLNYRSTDQAGSQGSKNSDIPGFSQTYKEDEQVTKHTVWC